MTVRRSFLVLIIAGAVLSIALAFYKFYIEKDYLIHAHVPCDPFVDPCFIGVEDETGAPQFYKEVQKMAYAIPACNGWKDACPPLACKPGEPLCTEIYCAPGGDIPCTGSAQ